MNQTRRTTTARHDGAQVTTSQRPEGRWLPDRPVCCDSEAVRDRTGLSRSTIWRLERRGTFPMHRRISLNAVGWLERGGPVDSLMGVSVGLRGRHSPRDQFNAGPISEALRSPVQRSGICPQLRRPSAECIPMTSWSTPAQS